MIKENKETCQKGVIAQGFAGSGKKLCFWQVFSYKNSVDTGLIFISDFFNSNFFDEHSVTVIVSLVTSAPTDKALASSMGTEK